MRGCHTRREEALVRRVEVVLLLSSSFTLSPTRLAKRVSMRLEKGSGEVAGEVVVGMVEESEGVGVIFASSPPPLSPSPTLPVSISYY